MKYNKIMIWMLVFVFLISPVFSLTDFRTGLMTYHSGETGFSDDWSGHHNPATNTADFESSNCFNNGCYNFTSDGSTVITFNNDTDFSFQHSGGDTPFTISVWIRTSTDNMFLTRYDQNGAGFNEYLIQDNSGVGYSINAYDADNDYISTRQGSANPNGIWQHVVLTYDGSKSNKGFTWYRNATNVTNTYTGSGTYNGFSDLATTRMGCRSTDGATCEAATSYGGQIDEFAIWINRTFSQTEVTDIFNSGTGCFLGQDCFNGTNLSAPTSPTSNLDIIFKDESNVTTTVFDEGEDFRIFLNHSLSNHSYLNSDCNVSLEEGILEFEDDNNQFNLCGVGCNYSKRTNTANFDGKNLLGHTGTNDTVHFNICHEQQAIGDVNVSISCAAGSYWTEITAETIPTCLSGTETIFVSNNVCVASQNTNFSIEYNGINVRRKNITGFAIDRKFSVLKTKATHFDGSLNYNRSTFEYYTHGSKTINATCFYNATLSNTISQSITIVNIPPTIIHSAIIVGNTQYNMTNNTLIEYEGDENYEFIIAIDDDDVEYLNHTLICGNGSVLWSVEHANGNHSHVITPNNFTDFDCNPYLFRTWVNDTVGNYTQLWTVFNVTDTINPQVSGFTGFSQTFNTTLNRSITFTDENFFSYNITCNNSYENSKTGLNALSYVTFLNFTMPENNVFCSVNYCDGHTTKTLKKDWNVLINDNTYTFHIDHKYEKTLEFHVENVSLNYTEKKDRIVFEATILDDIKYRDWLITYPCENCYYFESDKYKAWIVDPKTNTWLDLNGVREEINTFYNDGVWEFRFNSNTKKISFESIGELNCQDANMTITSIPVAQTPFTVWFGKFSNPGSCNMNDTKDILILFFVYTLLIAFFLLNQIYIKMPAVDIMLGLTMLIYGISLYSCGMIIVLINTCVALIVIAHGAFNK